MTVKMKKKLATEQETLLFGEQLAKAMMQGATIFLEGPLGAGKTTLTRGFLRGFGYTHKVKSPTYTLVEPYEVAGQAIYHFDLYRLNDASELEHIGINEYFSSTAICLIEWPEKGAPFLPAPDLICTLSFDQMSREVRLEAMTDKGKLIISRI